MPIKGYGVFVGYPKSFVAEKDDSSPHLELYSSEDASATKGDYRAAINIKSSTVEESRLVYWFVKNIDNHPIVDEIESLEPGFHALKSTGAPALDFIRGNIFDLNSGAVLRHNVPGENNDIIDYITPVLNEAITRKATIYLFGQSFPGGIHDVHMNQGNDGKFAKDNGIFQDGGILFHFQDDGHWEGIFLAFAVQKVHTDDKTGNSIGHVDFAELLGGSAPPVSQPEPPTGGEDPTEPTKPTKPTKPQEGAVLIRAALVNPVGPDAAPSGDPETVYLRNNTQQDMDLNGWSLVNRAGQHQKLSGSLPGLGEHQFGVPDCPLSNKGGTITLLDSKGLKVDGVSYSKAQAKREGKVVYFHSA